MNLCPNWSAELKKFPMGSHNSVHCRWYSVTSHTLLHTIYLRRKISLILCMLLLNYQKTCGRWTSTFPALKTWDTSTVMCSIQSTTTIKYFQENENKKFWTVKGQLLHLAWQKIYSSRGLSHSALYIYIYTHHWATKKKSNENKMWQPFINITPGTSLHPWPEIWKLTVANKFIWL